MTSCGCNANEHHNYRDDVDRIYTSGHVDKYYTSVSVYTGSVSIKIEIERVFTDYYYALRQWVISVYYSNSSASFNESILYTYARHIAHVLGRLINVDTKVIRLIEGILHQYIEMSIRIVKAIVTKQSIEELYFNWKDIVDMFVELIHRYYPCISKGKLKELFYAFLHALRNEFYAILDGDWIRARHLGEIALDHLRHMLAYLYSHYSNIKSRRCGGCNKTRCVC